MKKYLLIVLLILTLTKLQAQENTQLDSGTFLLHKFEKQLGKEVYHVSKTGETLVYNINFKFVDRGSAVPLNAVLKLTVEHEPVALFIKGRTSRSSTINDTLSFNGNDVHIKVDDSSFIKKKTQLMFPVAGYSPGTVQQELLQYWKNHKKPEFINTVPFGSVKIKTDGTDRIDFNGLTQIFDRYTISGLIWGNELLWTDNKGKLVALITNDAEADKLEMVKEAYEPLLPKFISLAATYSMQLFVSNSPQLKNKEKVIALVGGNLIDVKNGITIPNSVIILENGLIKAVGKVGELTIPSGAKVIDTKNKTILPGLWDMHAHFEQAEWGPAYLAAGVTTVRDCGNEFGYINAIKKAIDEGKGIGPEILKAGIIDGKGPYGLGIIQAETKEEAIKAVDRYNENGFVQIKIYSSVKPAIVKAICDEAHRLGLTVTGHIPNGMTLQAGIDSGMDMVNHVQYVYSIMKRNKDRSINFEDSISIAAIKFIKDHHVVIDPTIGVFEMSFRSVKEDITVMEPNFYNLPLPLQALFKNTGQDDAGALKFKPLYQSMVKIVKILYDNGIPIVAGTDQGFPGYSLYRELELYVAAGLSPLQSIQTATITPAQVMKLDKSFGSVDVGKVADLVIVDGDPLSNIRDIRKVSLVFKNGQPIDPIKLHQLVGFTK